MSDALQRLIDAVERANWDGSWRGVLEVDKMMPPHAFSLAYHGSLDGAKAVHDALLPEWRLTCLGQVVNFHDGSTAPEWSARLDHSTKLRHVESIAVDPARAWLLAILRAYQQVQQ